MGNPQSVQPEIMLDWSSLEQLAARSQVNIALVNAGMAEGLSWAGLAQPLRLAQKLSERCLLQTLSLKSSPALLQTADIVLLVADEGKPPQLLTPFMNTMQAAKVWGAVGAPVLWLARAGLLTGVRIALPWGLYAEVDTVAERAILTANLFELDQQRMTCAGAAASLDFALTLIAALFGKALAAQIQEMLCVDRVRDGTERQRVALQARFGVLQPKLSEAVALMEANIEEPLTTDDIASLVGLSRRQLERLFKQHLDNLPSRYYLELRLNRARQLLLESHHSIVQIGLMCGFSSGSHFSTAFGMLFGITPREERQRRLQNQGGSANAGEK